MSKQHKKQKKQSGNEGDMGTCCARCWERRRDTLPIVEDIGNDGGSSVSSAVPGHVFNLMLDN